VVIVGETRFARVGDLTFVGLVYDDRIGVFR